MGGNECSLDENGIKKEKYRKRQCYTEYGNSTEDESIKQVGWLQILKEYENGLWEWHERTNDISDIQGMTRAYRKWRWHTS